VTVTFYVTVRTSCVPTLHELVEKPEHHYVPLLSNSSAVKYPIYIPQISNPSCDLPKEVDGASQHKQSDLEFKALASTVLLFLNDARIPASEYISTIRGHGKSIEHALYPPAIERRRFMRAHNYPIYFVKYPTDVVPTGGRYEYNQGEQGLLERGTDYFVIDSYTYDRFYTDSVCETNPVECDFFKRLLAGDVPTYRLVKEFTYELPAYLPRVRISAVNPDIKIYERVP
jgi:hypothetical protein